MSRRRLCDVRECLHVCCLSLKQFISSWAFFNLESAHFQFLGDDRNFLFHSYLPRIRIAFNSPQNFRCKKRVKIKLTFLQNVILQSFCKLSTSFVQNCYLGLLLGLPCQHTIWQLGWASLKLSKTNPNRAWWGRQIKHLRLTWHKK